MKYCPHCGAEVNDDAVVCVSCGRQIPQANSNSEDNSTLSTVAKVFLILGCISIGWCLIPLIWCIPITVSIFKKLNTHQPIGTGLKVCALLFVSLIGGIILLCMKDDNNVVNNN